MMGNLGQSGMMQSMMSGNMPDMSQMMGGMGGMPDLSKGLGGMGGNPMSGLAQMFGQQPPQKKSSKARRIKNEDLLRHEKNKPHKRKHEKRTDNQKASSV